MYTIDEFIARLQQLREVAPDGGNTPVVIDEGREDCSLTIVAVELRPVVEVLADIEWRTLNEGNTTQVVCVY